MRPWPPARGDADAHAGHGAHGCGPGVGASAPRRAGRRAVCAARRVVPPRRHRCRRARGRGHRARRRSRDRRGIDRGLCHARSSPRHSRVASSVRCPRERHSRSRCYRLTSCRCSPPRDRRRSSPTSARDRSGRRPLRARHPRDRRRIAAVCPPATLVTPSDAVLSCSSPPAQPATQGSCCASVDRCQRPRHLRALAIHARYDIGVSWLPLHHDMGLVGMLLGPGLPPARRTVLLPPLAFVKRPTLWLKAIAKLPRHRELRAVIPPTRWPRADSRPSDCDQLDLAPLARGRLRRRADRPVRARSASPAPSSACGFRRTGVHAVLRAGRARRRRLASPPPGRGLVIDVVSGAARLAVAMASRCRALAPTSDARRIVSCGRAARRTRPGGRRS